LTIPVKLGEKQLLVTSSEQNSLNNFRYCTVVKLGLSHQRLSVFEKRELIKISEHKTDEITVEWRIYHISAAT